MCNNVSVWSGICLQHWLPCGSDIQCSVLLYNRACLACPSSCDADLDSVATTAYMAAIASFCCSCGQTSLPVTPVTLLSNQRIIQYIIYNSCSVAEHLLYSDATGQHQRHCLKHQGRTSAKVGNICFGLWYCSSNCQCQGSGAAQAVVQRAGHLHFHLANARNDVVVSLS